MSRLAAMALSVSFSVKGLVEQAHWKFKIFSAIESYLMAHWEESVESNSPQVLAEGTLAYALISDDHTAARTHRSAMLERSLEYKQRENSGEGLTPEQQKRLDNLITQYRRNPKCFTENQPGIKPGTKLMRNWKGERHTVTVLEDGLFSHKGKKYTSLSEVASIIAGSRWNGWAFFGLKYKKGKKA